MSPAAPDPKAAFDRDNDAENLAPEILPERQGYEFRADGRLKISAGLSISNAAELGDVLRGQLTGATDLILDLSETPACDTAALQMFCSFAKTAAARNRRYGIAESRFVRSSCSRWFRR